MGKAILLAGAALAAVLAVGAGTSWFGLVTGRPMAKYAEETRREVVETSRAYQHGTNAALSGYCLNMRLAETPTRQRAFARLIVTEADAYRGNTLAPDVEACVADARANF